MGFIVEGIQREVSNNVLTTVYFTETILVGPHPSLYDVTVADIQSQYPPATNVAQQSITEFLANNSGQTVSAQPPGAPNIQELQRAEALAIFDPDAEGSQRECSFPGFSQIAARAIAHKIPGCKPLITIFANGNTPGGSFKASGSSAQEESVIADSNLAHAMPAHYIGNNIINMGGTLLVLNVTLTASEQRSLPATSFHAIIIASPCLNDYGVESLKTPYEGGLFNFSNAATRRNDYMNYLMGLRMLEFSMARKLGQPLIAGAAGCGVYGNDRNMVAASYRVVAAHYPDVTVLYALGPAPNERYTAFSEGFKIHVPLAETVYQRNWAKLQSPKDIANEFCHYRDSLEHNSFLIQLRNARSLSQWNLIQDCMAEAILQCEDPERQQQLLQRYKSMLQDRFNDESSCNCWFFWARSAPPISRAWEKVKHLDSELVMTNEVASPLLS
jgi:hypothetical protein